MQELTLDMRFPSNVEGEESGHCTAAKALESMNCRYISEDLRSA